MKTAKTGYTNWRAELLDEAGIEFTTEDKQLKTCVTKLIVVKGEMNSVQLLDKIFELLRIKRISNPTFGFYNE